MLSHMISRSTPPPPSLLRLTLIHLIIQEFTTTDHPFWLDLLLNHQGRVSSNYRRPSGSTTVCPLPKGDMSNRCRRVRSPINKNGRLAGHPEEIQANWRRQHMGRIGKEFSVESFNSAFIFYLKMSHSVVSTAFRPLSQIIICLWGQPTNHLRRHLYMTTSPQPTINYKGPRDKGARTDWRTPKKTI